jgi:hypothetical protein
MLGYISRGVYMRICNCGGVLTQHNLVPVENEPREAWTCTECQRYEIIRRTLVKQTSKTIKESLMDTALC